MLNFLLQKKVRNSSVGWITRIGVEVPPGSESAVQVVAIALARKDKKGKKRGAQQSGDDSPLHHPFRHSHSVIINPPPLPTSSKKSLIPIKQPIDLYGDSCWDTTKPDWTNSWIPRRLSAGSSICLRARGRWSCRRTHRHERRPGTTTGPTTSLKRSRRKQKRRTNSNATKKISTNWWVPFPSPPPHPTFSEKRN